MKKQRLGFTCMLAILITMAAFFNPVHANTSFTDETPIWAKEAVDYLVEKGVIEGVGDNRFAPDKELTRGEAAKILALSLELNVNMNEKTNLVDASDHWASPYIKAIQTLKPSVIDGYPDGTFKPNGFVTREEMTKMIVLAYGFKRNPEGPTLEFKDVSGWATDYIEILASNGIIAGKDTGIFAPKEHLNRAEAATIISRADSMLPVLIIPEFNDKKTVQQDEIKFEVMLSEIDAKLYVKVKATNVSEETIPYWGKDGCDPGLSADLFAEMENEQFQVGGKWINRLRSCPQAIMQRELAPGESIEILEVLYPPEEGFSENQYVKIVFSRGSLDSESPSNPIEIEIPIEIEHNR